MISQENIGKILTLLSERLQLSLPAKKWSFLVCGGTALNVLKLIDRTTKDVDVIGVIKNNELVRAELEEEFFIEIKIVAEYFSIPSNWFNTGPEAYIQSGLPRGLIKRLTWHQYGPNLFCGFISRIDQIYLKLYASVDRGGYHVTDLNALNPTEKEILNASIWTLQQDVSSGYKMILISMLKQIGYQNAAEKISE